MVARRSALRVALGVGGVLLASLAGAGVETLSGPWALQSSRKVVEAGEVLSLASYHPSGWYVARVPTTVVAAQVASGEFPDPNVGTNLRKMPGMTYPIGANSFANLPIDPSSPYAASWWFRREFLLPGGGGKTVVLRFRGINYAANIFLNGHKVADRAKAAGAYRIHEFDVTPYVSEKNVLAVEVFAPTEKQLGINWVDWNPTPPDKSMGLWGDVEVRTSGPVVVRHSSLTTRFPQGSLAEADLTLRAVVRNLSGESVSGTLEAETAFFRLQKQVALAPGEERSVVMEPAEYPTLRVKDPVLWWPVGMGQPVLHDLHVRYVVGAAVSEEETSRFGIREVTSELTAEGYRLFRVNGRKLLVRGGGWAQDMLLRPASPARLEAELDYVRDLGLNTIRLEAQIESGERLFDLADEKGILLLAGWCCCDIWEKWDQWGRENVEVATESLRSELLRLRRHPSLLAWLNGSDGPPPGEVERAYLEVEREVSWPNPILSSASDVPTGVSGPSGVKMTGPYDYEPPSYWLQAGPPSPPAPLESTRYGGGFGFNTETSPGPAIPPLQSLRKMLPKDQLWPIDEVWTYHSAGERFQDLAKFREAMDRTYGPPSSLEDFLRKAQAMAYDAERAMFEAYSDRKRSTGVIQWMLNNAWPSLYWHLFDYELYPAGSYFGAKKGCESLHVQFSYPDRSVVVVNNQNAKLTGLELSARLLSSSLKEIASHKATVEVGPEASTAAFQIEKAPPGTGVTFLVLSLRDSASSERSRNFYWLPETESAIAWDKATDTDVAPMAVFEDLKSLQSLPRVRLVSALQIENGGRSARVSLENPASGLAFQVHAGLRGPGSDEEILPVLWDDNYVSILPGEKRVLVARFREALPPGTTLLIDGWNVEPEVVAAH